MADRYSNIAHIKVVEGGTDTLTYKKLETGVSLFEKVAWIIARIEYYWLGFTLPATGDGVIMALTTSNNPVALTPEEVAIIDMTKITRIDFGTAANAHVVDYPIIRDFAQLPGGGMIVPPNPLYLAVVGISQAGALTIECRIYYTTIVLKGDEFWELVEARRIISSS